MNTRKNDDKKTLGKVVRTSFFDPKCHKCRNYNGNILVCESCAHYNPPPEPVTLFHQITASEEVLAEKLVYQFIAYDSHGLFVSCWRSTLTGDIEYRTRAEALAETVAKLKDVAFILKRDADVFKKIALLTMEQEQDR